MKYAALLLAPLSALALPPDAGAQNRIPDAGATSRPTPTRPTPTRPTPTRPTPATRPRAPDAGTTANLPVGLDAFQLSQLAQLTHRGLSGSQVQSVADAFAAANRAAAPRHPTFTPDQLTQLARVGAGNYTAAPVRALAQSMLGGR